MEEGWAEIAELVQEGKVRYAGASNFDASARCAAPRPSIPIASLQPPYSMLDQRVEAEMLPFCAANDIGVVAYSPMQTGLLTGKFTRERIAALPADDVRHKNGDFQDPAGPNLARMEALRPSPRETGAP